MIGAVDIGGTKIAVGMLNREGKILARLEQPSGRDLEVKEGLEMICAMLRETSRQVDDQLEGIGVGSTGPVDPFSGKMGFIDFLPRWENCNLVDELQNAFGVKTFLENDADAAALAELAWGAGQGARRFIYLTVSTGIGAGLVFDGKLYRGANGAHPEIGHHVIDPSGPLCSCGFRGCWEILASGPALATYAGMGSALEVCKAAAQGSPLAQAAVEREAYYLGLGIANLVTLFVPDVISLGGGVMHSQHLFWDKINRTIREGCGLVPFEKTKLVPAYLGPDTGLAGAAQVWIKGIEHHG